MVNRDRHDITMEILRKAASGKRKTELMRDVGLSYSQAKQYLSLLTRKTCWKWMCKTASKQRKFRIFRRMYGMPPL